jgi:hypothetical protein
MMLPRPMRPWIITNNTPFHHWHSHPCHSIATDSSIPTHAVNSSSFLFLKQLYHTIPTQHSISIMTAYTPIKITSPDDLQPQPRPRVQPQLVTAPKTSRRLSRYICTACTLTYILLAYISWLVFGGASDGGATFLAWAVLLVVRLRLAHRCAA